MKSEYLVDNNQLVSSSYILRRSMKFTTNKNYFENQVKKTKKPLDSSNYIKFKKIISLNKSLHH